MSRLRRTSRITSSSSTTRMDSWFISPLLGRPRQEERGQGHLEGRALTGLALHEDGPAVLLHDAVGHAQAESCPAAHALRGEEGVVDPPDVLAAESRPAG